MSSGLTLIDIDATLWSVWSVSDLFGRGQDQRTVGDDVLSVSVTLVAADALAVIASLFGSIWDADCHLVAFMSTSSANVEGIWESGADEGAVSVDALLAELVASVVDSALINISTAGHADSGVVFETVAAEAFEAHAIVSFFVVVWDASSSGNTSVSSIVASSANCSGTALGGLAVVATDGVDASLVVGTIVSSGETFVDVLAVLAVTGVTVSASTLEAERSSSESAHGIFVAIMGTNGTS